MAKALRPAPAELPKLGSGLGSSWAPASEMPETGSLRTTVVGRMQDMAAGRRGEEAAYSGPQAPLRRASDGPCPDHMTPMLSPAQARGRGSGHVDGAGRGACASATRKRHQARSAVAASALPSRAARLPRSRANRRTGRRGRRRHRHGNANGAAALALRATYRCAGKNRGRFRASEACVAAAGTARNYTFGSSLRTRCSAVVACGFRQKARRRRRHEHAIAASAAWHGHCDALLDRDHGRPLWRDEETQRQRPT